MDDLNSKVDRGFASVDKHFELVEQRFEHVDTRFEQVDKRLERIEARLDAMQRMQATFLVTICGCMFTGFATLGALVVGT